MNQVGQNILNANLLSKLNVTMEVRLLLEVFVRIYFRKSELEYVIKFLVGSNVAEANAFRLTSPIEKKLYASGKLRSVGWWKDLSRLLAQRGFFGYRLGNQTAGSGNHLALSDKQLFEDQTYLTIKAQQWFMNKSEELIIDATEFSCQEAEIPEVPGNVNVQNTAAVLEHDEVTLIEKSASKPKKRLRVIRQQHYKAFPIMSEAPSSFPSNIALSDFAKELRESLQKLSNSHVKMMVKMLEPLGDYEIYLIHAFFFYSTVMIGQHKIVHVDKVADFLAKCVKLGFPIHLSSLEIDHKMIREVHNKVNESGGVVSDLKLIMNRLPKGLIDLNRLNIVLAILEFEYGLEQESATGNLKETQQEKDGLLMVETIATESDKYLPFTATSLQYSCAMTLGRRENEAVTILPSCGVVVRSEILPHRDVPR